MNELTLRSILCTVCIVVVGCGTKKEDNAGRAQRAAVIIAVEGDIDSFNPLFAEEITAGEINDLIFPGLVGSDFDRAAGELRYTPSLARSWEWSNQGRDITFHLRGNAYWTDGKRVTARDVQISYVLYGDPDVSSVRQVAVENLKLTNGRLDVVKSVEPIDDSTVVFHFVREYPGQLFDAGLPIVPAHIFSFIQRADIRSHATNKSPVGFGPFKLARWVPLQEIILESNPQSVVPFPAKVPQLIFRVIPEYRSRISQFESGEIDILAGLRIEDAQKFKDKTEITIVSIPGRDYDFLGWNNIDPVAYGKSRGKVVQPHRLFGSASVRRALTMAINRSEIVQAYLGSHGQEAIGGISPLFKWAYNDTLKPLPFDQSLARSILKREGWNDNDGDGVLDKDGLRFSFMLKVPAGNQLRTVVAAVVQRQLKNVKIEMNIEQVERATFWQEVTARKYDAWLAGFSVPLQMQLDDLWGSDLERYPFNLTGFRNKRVDQILDKVKNFSRESDGAPLWKEFQILVQQEQPCTFLFWINNIVGVNKRVHGSDIGVLGTTHKAWEWTLDGEKSEATVAIR